MILDSILPYYKSGLELFKKSYWLPLIPFIIYFPVHLLRGITNLNIGVLLLITYSLLLIYYGFQFSLPKLLRLQQQQDLTGISLMEEIASASRRLILPLIVVLIVILVLAFLFGFILYISRLGGSLNSQFGGAMSILVSLAEALFIFAPIYFSLENKGILKSIQLSLLIFWKHPDFFLPLIIFELLKSYIQAIVSSSSLFGYGATLLIVNYLQLWWISSALLFYQVIKEDLR